MCFTFGDFGFNARMQLAQTYRSLPRPSSLSKPSYPSNSIIVESIFINHYLKWETKLISVSSVFIEYKLSNSFRDRRSRRSSFDCYFFKSISCFLVISNECDCDFISSSENGPVGNRTRDPSVQGRYFTTRLQAQLFSARVYSSCTGILSKQYFFVCILKILNEAR
jgi:hypothetical protein